MLFLCCKGLYSSLSRPCAGRAARGAAATAVPANSQMRAGVLQRGLPQRGCLILILPTAL